MEKKTFANYEAPVAEIMEIEIEQAVLAFSGTGDGEGIFPDEEM